MNYITTSDRVLVEPDSIDEKTVGGFIIAYDDDATLTGTVVMVGPGRVTKKDVTIPVSLNVGDKVIFPKGTGISVNIEGNGYLLFKENEIIGTME